VQWAVALRQKDICATKVMMAGFRAAPHEGPMERLKRVYFCLKNSKKHQSNPGPT